MVTILSTRLTRDKRNELSCKYRHYEGFIDDVDEEEKANSSKVLVPTLTQAPTTTKVGQVRCIAPKLDIHTLSRGVPSPSNPNSGGVFISKSIIEAHGGRIWADNNAYRSCLCYRRLRP